MRIKQISEALRVSPELILKIEREGIFHPERSPFGHRIFSQEDVAKLQRIIEERANRTKRN